MAQDLISAEPSFDAERYRRWTHAFITLQNIGQPVTPEKNSHWLWIYEVAKGLARFDAKLVAEDRWASSLFGGETWTRAEHDRLSDHFTLSQLWIMGSYELLRTTVCQLKKNEKEEKKRHEERLTEIKKLNKIQGQKKIKPVDFQSDPLLIRADSLLKEFERLRMPLAKLEPAKAFESSDSPIARPGLSRSGVGWTMHSDIFVTRTELADRLVEVLSGYTTEEMQDKYNAFS